MLIEEFIEHYNSHIHALPSIPISVQDIPVRFPIGCFVIDEAGNVGLVTNHAFHNPSRKHGPVKYGSIMFVGPDGRMWTTDFLNVKDRELRRVSKLGMIALAADSESTGLESLMRLGEIYQGRKG